MSMPANAVQLPPGVTIDPGRETSQLGPNSQMIEGMKFTLTLPSGAQPTVFIPYALMTDRAKVTELIAQRVAAVEGVVGLSTTTG